MNLKRSRITAIMTLVVSILAEYAALKGIFDNSLYQDTLNAGAMTKSLVWGSIAQDIIAVPLGLILAVLSILFLKHPGYKTFIAILGLTGNFFYGFGLYTIQGQYTSIYLLYLAIFALSIYSLIYGFLSFEAEKIKNYQLPQGLKISIIIFMLIILGILGPGWVMGVNSGVATHTPADTYAVYILDLSIVFPAFGIIIYQLIRNMPFAAAFTGVALFKMFTVCLSWGFAQWFVPIYSGGKFEISMTVISTTLAFISLIFIFCYMFKLREETAK